MTRRKRHELVSEMMGVSAQRMNGGLGEAQSHKLAYSVSVLMGFPESV